MLRFANGNPIFRRRGRRRRPPRLPRTEASATVPPFPPPRLHPQPKQINEIKVAATVGRKHRRQVRWRSTRAGGRGRARARRAIRRTQLRGRRQQGEEAQAVPAVAMLVQAERQWVRVVVEARLVGPKSWRAFGCECICSGRCRHARRRSRPWRGGGGVERARAANGVRSGTAWRRVSVIVARTRITRERILKSRQEFLLWKTCCRGRGRATGARLARRSARTAGFLFTMRLAGIEGTQFRPHRQLRLASLRGWRGARSDPRAAGQSTHHRWVVGGGVTRVGGGVDGPPRRPAQRRGTSAAREQRPLPCDPRARRPPDDDFERRRSRARVADPTCSRSFPRTPRDRARSAPLAARQRRGGGHRGRGPPRARRDDGDAPDLVLLDVVLGVACSSRVNGCVQAGRSDPAPTAGTDGVRQGRRADPPANEAPSRHARRS